MPELPEVETIRRDLQRALRGKVFRDVVVGKPKLARGSRKNLTKFLKGAEIVGVKRRGKLLILEISNGLFLLMHMKMTGQLIYVDKRHTVAGGHSYPPVGELPGKYSHFIFNFTDGSALYFNDMRQFGYVMLVDEEAKEKVAATYGAEPLSAAFTIEYLASVLKRRQAPLKNVLLDQTAIAGLGNIYVDEACFHAGIRPMRRASSLTKKEIEKLHTAIVHILKLSIEHRGTTFNNYRDGAGRKGNFVHLLKVYGRGGEPCLKCKSILKKVKVAGRGTVYCPKCQS
jgi:formamidopyrimidine-DNA glycosylase